MIIQFYEPKNKIFTSEKSPINIASIAEIKKSYIEHSKDNQINCLFIMI